MGVRQSKQSFTVTEPNVYEINDAMQRIQEELDRMVGLRGPVVIYDSVQYVDDHGTIIHSWGAKPSLA